DCQAPVPGRTTTPLSVCRKPTNNGAALVSCLTTAFRYWSSVVFRHARSHVCADAMPVANAAIKRKRAECVKKRAECIGETSALHSAPICTVFTRLLRPLLVLQCPRCSGRMKIIAAIVSPEVACRILDSLGIVSRPPPLLPARRRTEELEHCWSPLFPIRCCSCASKLNSHLSAQLRNVLPGSKKAYHARILSAPNNRIALMWHGVTTGYATVA